LLSKKKLRNIYSTVLPSYSSNLGLQLSRAPAEYQYTAPTSPDINPAMSFNGFLICLTKIAVESSLCEQMVKEVIGDGEAQQQQQQQQSILSLLTWMERSNGKKKMSQSRTSMIVESFRSTVTPIKRTTRNNGSSGEMNRNSSSSSSSSSSRNNHEVSKGRRRKENYGVGHSHKV
jgi:hypothetical protein